MGNILKQEIKRTEREVLSTYLDLENDKQKFINEIKSNLGDSIKEDIKQRQEDLKKKPTFLQKLMKLFR
jgi:hypothetical protein